MINKFVNQNMKQKIEREEKSEKLVSLKVRENENKEKHEKLYYVSSYLDRK